MALGIIGEIGTVKTAAAGTTTVIPVTLSAAQGSAILVAFAPGDPLLHQLGTVSVLDSGGNSYTLAARLAVILGTALHVYAIFNCAALASGGTITITHPATRAPRLAQAFAATGAAAIDVLTGKSGGGNRTTSGLTAATHFLQEILWAPLTYHGPSGTRAALPDSWQAGSQLNIQNWGLRQFWKTVQRTGRYELAADLSQGLGVTWSSILIALKPAAESRTIIVTDTGYADMVPAPSGTGTGITRPGARTVTVTDRGVGTESVPGISGRAQRPAVTETGTAQEQVRVLDRSLTEELRLGARVPREGAGLAWLELPRLDPAVNLSLIDAASFAAENEDLVWKEAALPGTGELAPEGWFRTTQYNPSTPVPGAVQSGDLGYLVNRAPDAGTDPPTWSIQHFTSEIRVEHPQGADGSQPWYLRVQDGLVLRRHIMQAGDPSWLGKVFAPGDELVLFYTLQEMQRMPYAGDERTLTVTTGAREINGRTITLPHPYLWSLSSLKVNGTELLGDGVVTAATSFPTLNLTGWNQDRGEVTLLRVLEEDDRVEAAYSYQEFGYVFQGYWDEELGRYRDLDLNPAPGHTYDGGLPVSGLMSRPVYIYLLPSAAYRQSTLNADGSRTADPHRVIWSGTRFTESFLRWQAGAQGNDTF